MSIKVDYPLSHFLNEGNVDYEVDLKLFNKVVVFFYRIYDILSLLRQLKESKEENRSALVAKFQEPMDPTGRWFPGTIYQAMESPIDDGLQVKRINVALFDIANGVTIFDLKKNVEEKSFTVWGSSW